MSEPFIGEIRMFGGNFAPVGWALCDGRLLSISQYQALFAILGTTFGGNGQTTFAVPDLRGRVPMNWGQGPGLSPRTLGEISGSENVTLLSTQMPAHSHSLHASGAQGDQFSPEGNVSALLVNSSGQPENAYSAVPNTSMAPQAIGAAGGSQPHQNMQPYLCVSFIIALEGIFPSRS